MVETRRERQDDSLPTLHELVEEALNRFKSTEVYDAGTDGTEYLVIYSPLEAAYDTVEHLNANFAKLAMQLIESTSVIPTEILMFQSIGEQETWDEVFFTISRLIVEAQLSINHPEVDEEYEQRRKKFEHLT